MPVLLPECLRVNSCFLKNKQQQQKLDQNTDVKRKKAAFCDPGEHSAGLQEFMAGQLFILWT